MFRLSTLNGKERMSTQDVLSAIASAVAQGETEFVVSASGQHDIGGPLWSPAGCELNFQITNPGQRVGAMCLPGTTVIVNGSAPADVGWLNSGGTVIVRGDAGDTAGHCAAGGKIYIGGRAGTRTGSLMKHDPGMAAPELWVLNSTGSFSFEFMGGGRAVVCGHESQTLASVLGQRPCVGMVGGEIFVRGPVADLPEDVELVELDPGDIDWLDNGLDDFLEKVNRVRLKPEFQVWRHWRKIVPAAARASGKMGMSRFRQEKWLPGGLFRDVCDLSTETVDLVPTGIDRLRAPEWNNCNRRCTDCRICLESCPRGAVQRRAADQGTVYACNGGRCSGCGICAAVCPQNVWKLSENAERP